MELLLAALLLVHPAQASPFEHSVSRVTRVQLGSAWRPGCPVAPSRLRRVRLSYWGFDDRTYIGTVDAHADVTQGLVRVFRRLYAAGFPIRRMRPVAAYGGNDDRSMAADNTSAFNCRRLPGSQRWSAHAYGKAIDVNPVENPYLAGGRVQPPAGRAYVNRANVRPGMIVRGDLVVRTFAAAGWSWGGRWTGTPDYQHFSTTGG